MKKWFRFQTSWDAAIRTLPLEEGGRLLQAVMAYAITGETPALSGAAQAVFAMIAADIREDNEREQKISAKRSAAGARGAAKTNAGKRRQKAANAGTDRQMPANADPCQGKTANASKCRQMPTDIPEGPRIKALDSAPAEKTIQTEEERNIDIYPTILPSSSETSIRPSAEEVAAYCQELGYSVNAKEFVDYYNSNGWMIGNDPIRDWKAFVRIWERETAGTIRACRDGLRANGKDSCRTAVQPAGLQRRGRGGFSADARSGEGIRI